MWALSNTSSSSASPPAGLGGVCGGLGRRRLYRLHPGLNGVRHAEKEGQTVPRCLSANSSKGNALNHFTVIQCKKRPEFIDGVVSPLLPHSRRLPRLPPPKQRLFSVSGCLEIHWKLHWRCTQECETHKVVTSEWSPRCVWLYTYIDMF